MVLFLYSFNAAGQPRFSQLLTKKVLTPFFLGLYKYTSISAELFWSRDTNYTNHLSLVEIIRIRFSNLN